MVDDLGLASEVGDILGDVSTPTPTPSTEGKEEVKDEVDESAEVEDEEKAEVIEGKEEPEREEGEPAEPVEPVEGEDEDELTSLKKQNELLLQRLEEMSGGNYAPVAPPKVEEPRAEDTKSKALSFLKDDEDLDEVLDDKQKLNSLLVRVYEQAMVDARESVLTQIPRTVLAQVQQQIHLRTTVDSFLSEHENLKPVRKTVGVIANQVAAEHPDWDLVKVLGETAERSYKTLGIKRKALEKPKGGGSPAFASGGGSRKVVKDVRTSVQKEIDDLIS